MVHVSRAQARLQSEAPSLVQVIDDLRQMAHVSLQRNPLLVMRNLCHPWQSKALSARMAHFVLVTDHVHSIQLVQLEAPSSMKALPLVVGARSLALVSCCLGKKACAVLANPLMGMGNLHCASAVSKVPLVMSSHEYCRELAIGHVLAAYHEC